MSDIEYSVITSDVIKSFELYRFKPSLSLGIPYIQVTHPKVRVELKYSNRLSYPGGGEGGTLNFSLYVASGPASTIHPKKLSGISSTHKIFEILSTPENIPHSVPCP